MSMIRVERLSKRYTRCTAVNDVSFTVREGEVFALLGPNGSGKTTTLKCIVGLNVPTSGTVQVCGLDSRRYPRETRAMLAYLPQKVVFAENLTAVEVLRFYARLRGLPPTRAEQVLDRSGLRPDADRRVGEFSGGMIQRLGLAVVAMPETPILLLDEPTANLDPQGVKRFREFVLHQKENGRTIVFSTHLLAEAEQLADRVGIYVGGRLVAQESIENLRHAAVATPTIEDLYLHYVGMHDDDRPH